MNSQEFEVTLLKPPDIDGAYFIKPRRKTLGFSPRDMRRVACLVVGGVAYLTLSSALLYNVLYEHKDSLQV